MSIDHSTLLVVLVKGARYIFAMCVDRHLIALILDLPAHTCFPLLALEHIGHGPTQVIHGDDSSDTPRVVMKDKREARELLRAHVQCVGGGNWSHALPDKISHQAMDQ